MHATLRSRVSTAVAATLLLAGAAPLTLPTATAAPAASAAPAARGHDTLFPGSGSPALDVRHYVVRLRYDPAGNRLRASTLVTARSRQRLRTLTLDLEGLRVRQVLVAGRPAAWSRQGHHLVVKPGRLLPHHFRVRVDYRGVPRTHTDADGSSEGWVRTSDGAIGLGEPLGTMDWVPSNNTPGDKALWDYRVDVPRGFQVAANGDLTARERHGDRTTWVWHGSDPMTSYLATVAVGHFAVHRSQLTSVDGRTVPVYDFVDRAADGDAQNVAARRQLPRVIAFEEGYFGPYPFSSTGMIVDDADVGYALETQTRPFYPDDVDAQVHELAHQWFGDSVSVTDWHDLWIAEGFATYAEWLWDGAHGGRTPQQHYADEYAKPASDELWSPAPTSFTKPSQLFGEPVYTRGAMTLQALRDRIGDAPFLRILRAWARAHRHGNARTADFVHLAERLSGQQLDGFFDDWLVRNGKPQGY